MIHTLDRSRVMANAILAGVLSKCSELLHPKLRRLLNPNVIDAAIRLELHLQAGVLGHMRQADSEPSYVDGLTESSLDNPLVRETLTQCLRTLKRRLEHKLGAGWFGVVTLKVAISGGEATISSEEDGVCKPK
jgi:hypothetical protein